MRKLSKLKPYPNSPSNWLYLTLNVTAKQLPVQISPSHVYFWTLIIKERSPIAIAEPVMTTSLTMLVVVCLMSLCSCVFIRLDYPCNFSLGVLNGGFVVTYCPLRSARRFPHDDAG